MKSKLLLSSILFGSFAFVAWACGGGGTTGSGSASTGTGGSTTGNSSSAGTGGTTTASSGSATGGMTTASSSSGMAQSSSGSGTTSSTTSTSTSATSSSGSTMFVPKTVFTILLENHDYKEIVGSTNAPYINSLIAQYGLATNYMDSGSHPSLPNYLYLISGDTQYNSFGFIEYDPTIFPFPISADNLGNQLTTANINWRSYQESAGGTCVTASAGEYVCRHDPFLYFTDIQNNATLCKNTNVDYSQFAADLAAGTYRYMWITPNLLDDGHDPSSTAQDFITALKQSDTWLSTEVPKILASSVFQQGGVLFITWDEAEGRNGDSADQVPMIVVTPGIPHAGYTSNVAYSHANYLATVEDIFGLPRLGAAVGKASMKEFWGQ